MASLVDTRPAVTAGTITALPPAIAALAIALGWWHPSDGELAAVLGAISAIAAILGKFVASVVYSRATVKDLLGPPDTSAVPVAPESPPTPPPPPPPPPAPPVAQADAVATVEAIRLANAAASSPIPVEAYEASGIDTPPRSARAG